MAKHVDIAFADRSLRFVARRIERKTLHGYRRRVALDDISPHTTDMIEVIAGFVINEPQACYATDVEVNAIDIRFIRTTPLR